MANLKLFKTPCLTSRDGTVCYHSDMIAARLLRGLLAAVLLVALLTPYAKPVMCAGTDDGGMAMEHDGNVGAVWFSLDHHAAACHGQMGCASTLTPPILESLTGPRDLPVHSEPGVLFQRLAASHSDSPVTPPPRA